MKTRKWWQVKSNWAALTGTLAGIMLAVPVPGLALPGAILAAIAGGLGWAGVTDKAERFVAAGEALEKVTEK